MPIYTVGWNTFLAIIPQKMLNRVKPLFKELCVNLVHQFSQLVTKHYIPIIIPHLIRFRDECINNTFASIFDHFAVEYPKC